MPGVSGVTVVTNARVYYTTRAAAGASGARHSLRPLYREGQKFGQTSGAWRRENADICLSPRTVDRSKVTERQVSELDLSYGALVSNGLKHAHLT